MAVLAQDSLVAAQDAGRVWREAGNPTVFRRGEVRRQAFKSSSKAKYPVISACTVFYICRINSF